MRKWHDLLRGKDKDGKEDTQYFGISDPTKAPSQRLIEKASKGRIDEVDMWTVSASAKYIDREIRVRGADEEDLWKKYVFNAWVRACIDKIIKEVVTYKLIARPKKDKREDKTAIQRAKIVQDLLNNPNENIESFEDIRRKYLRDILVYDAGALEIVYDKNTPTELYDVKGSDIRLNIDMHGGFKNPEDSAYKLISTLDTSKTLAEWGVKEMIYFIANPVSGSVYGLSPIETLWNEIENDSEACDYNTKLLKHSGVISGVLAFPRMPAEMLKKNQRYWQEELRKKVQKLIVTNNDNVKFIKMGESQKDMQFLEYQKWILNKIMAVYGLQPIVMGVIDSTTGKLNSSEQREQFKKDAVLPLLNLEIHRLTDVLIANGFEFDDVEFAAVEPVSVDEEFDLEKVKTGCQYGIVTVNEARELINLPLLTDENGKPLPEGLELVSPQVSKYMQEMTEKNNTADEITQVKSEILRLLEEE